MFGDMGKMIKQVGEMKAKMAAVEKELQNTIIKTTARDGSLEVEINGKMKLKSVKFLKDVDTDKGCLEKTLLQTFGDALDQVSSTAQQKLSAVTGGLKIPGL